MDHTALEAVLLNVTVAEAGRSMFESAMVDPESGAAGRATGIYERAWSELEEISGTAGGIYGMEEVDELVALSEDAGWTKIDTKESIASDTKYEGGRGDTAGNVGGGKKKLQIEQVASSSSKVKAKMGGGLGGLFGSRQRSFTHTDAAEDGSSKAKAAADAAVAALRAE
jgi:hypothetical protein